MLDPKLTNDEAQEGLASQNDTANVQLPQEVEYPIIGEGEE